MPWSELREYGESPVALPFSALIKVSASLAPEITAVARDDILLDLVEAEVGAFATFFAQACAAARDSFGRRIKFVPATSRLLPWVPSAAGDLPVSSHTPHRWIHSGFLRHQPLAGQTSARHIIVATINVHTSLELDANPITISVESIVLEAGSLIASVKGSITVATAAITLVSSALAIGPIKGYLDDRRYDQHHEQVIAARVKDQDCLAASTWHVDLTSLRALGIAELDYSAAGLTTQRKLLRVCYVQLALSIAQGSPGLIDGIVGQKTREALSAYAEAHDLAPNISSEVLRGLLLGELQHLQRS